MQQQVLFDRWNALNSAIQIHKTWLGSQPPGSKRLEILQCLVNHLEEFAKGQFNFFCEGFQSTKPIFIAEQANNGLQANFDNSSGKLAESNEFPPDHVLKTILDQISDDLDVIRRAAADEVISNNGTAATLATGDCLVQQALEPAQALGINKPVALTYFQKSAAIRVIPYDNDSISLIGLPFTSLQVPRDFLAVPHETGHFVFWNGEAYKQPMWKAIREAVDASDVSQWIKPWTEEIFADVYGCLLAGPIIALSFQDLQLLESFNKFITDDGVHPTPLIRPHVYSETLQLMGDTPWSNALNARWNNILTNWPHPSNMSLTLANQDHILLSQSSMVQTGISPSEFASINGYFQVPLAVAKQEINKIIGIIYPFLSSAFSRENTANNWWYIINDLYSESCEAILENADDIYTLFDTYVTDEAHHPCNQPKGTSETWACDDQFIWTDWVAQQSIADIQNGQVISTVISEDDWKTIWIADGWATRGPMANWP